MKEPEKSSRKHMGEFRKQSISQRTRSDNANPFAAKDELFSALLPRQMKSLGRKYAQQNLFKGKEKDHHQIVISDEVVRNSKQFRSLRQKMQMREAIFSKQIAQLSESRASLKQEISAVKSNSYNSKLAVWEIKNQILELKGVLNDEEEQARRLERELSAPHRQYYDQEDEHQYQCQEEGPAEEGENMMANDSYDPCRQLRINSEEQNQPNQQIAIEVKLVNPQNINPLPKYYEKQNNSD